MIVTRSPLRIPLGGGGTDLPSYYAAHGGFLIAAAIDKYVYITLSETFVDELVVKYSRTERVARASEIEHPLIREALRLVGFDGPRLEITSVADIPAGTGLGSSGSFTTALLKALHTLKGNAVHPRELAEQACHIEIDLAGAPVGKQDQYAAAFGGLTCFTFLPDRVEACPLRVSVATRHDLEDHLLLFFTGYTRAAASILQEQDTKSRAGDRVMIENLHFVKDLAHQSRAALESGDLRAFGEIMNVHWEFKRRRSQAMTNEHIDRWYDLAIRSGAVGGKVIGAGGGGFLLFYAQDARQLRRALADTPLREVRFRFDLGGTSLVAQS